MRRALDLFFALRPLHLIPAFALYGAGAAWGRGGGGSAARDGAVALAAFVGPLLSLLLLLAAVHAANSWRDREGDARNRKGAAVTRGLVRPRDLARAGAACAALGLLLALLPLVPPAARALLLLAAALGAAYVAPGIALKERPGLDLASHALGYGVVAFLLGAASAHALDADSAAAWRRALAAALPYAIGIAAVSTLTMIADAPGDEAVGQRTTATALGAGRALDLTRLLAWGAALTGLLAVEAVPALWGLGAATWLGLDPPAADRTTPPSGSARANRLALLLQLLFLALLALRAPWTGIAALLLGAAASAYNRARLGDGYPIARVLGRESVRASGRPGWTGRDGG